MLAYHTGLPATISSLKSSQFEETVKPPKSTAFSKDASQSDDLAKDLSLLSTPPTPAGVRDADPLEREKAILYQQLLDIRAEINDLEFHLEDLRGQKAKEAIAGREKGGEGRKKGGTGIGPEAGLESVLDYLLQINNATFLPTASPDKLVDAVAPKKAPPVADDSPQATSEEQINVAKEAMSDVQIRRLAIFTKIVFTETSNRLISAKNGVHIRQYDLAGSTHDLRFRVMFEVDEAALTVTRLEVKIAHGARREMGRFIRSVEQDCNLHAFFKGLVRYAQLNLQRRQLFEALGRTFPDLIHSSGVTIGAKRKATEAFGDIAGDGIACMTFRKGSLTGPELVFAWDLDVTPEGHVVPNVRMLPRVTRQWTAADKKRIVDTIPAQFQRLVEVKGLQAAVEILVRVIFRMD